MEQRQFGLVSNSMNRIEGYLKKIEANTRKEGELPTPEQVTQEAANNNSGAQSTDTDLGKMGVGIKGIVDALVRADKIKPKSAEKIIGFLEKLNDKVLSKVDKEKFESAGNLFTNVAGQLNSFSEDLAKAAPTLLLLSPVLPLLGNSIGAFVTAIDASVHEDTKSRVGVISAVGKAVFQFSMYMLGSVPGAIAGIAVIPIVALTAGPLLFALTKIKDVKKVNEGIGMLPKLGLGILAFSASMAASALIIGAVSVDPVKFAVLFGIMGLSALTMGLVGKFAPQIRDGNFAVVGMGLSILAFSGAVYFATKLVPPFEQSANLLLTIGTAGLVFFIAGKVFKEILLGSLAIAGMGLALMLISNPIKTIASAMSENPQSLWQLPVLLTGLGAVFALAGAGPVPLLIGAGALAFGAMGLALMGLSTGLEKILNLPVITKERAEGIELALKAVVTGFGKSFSDLSLKESLTLPLKIPMVGLMGLSLMSLSHGLKAYQQNAGDWKQSDTELFVGTIRGLSQGFAIAGSTDGMSSLFGFSVGKNDVERGIDSTMKIGRNLKELSEGILAWKSMEFTEADVQQVSDNVSMILNTIPAVFATIGAREAESTGTMSFYGLTFENPFSKGDVSRGIESVEKLGGTLKSLADGVMAWSDGGKAGFKSDQVPKIKQNILDVLSIVPSAFAEIGREDKESEGIFPWSDGDITRGVELVESLGPSLSSIADLLNAVKGQDITEVTDQLVTNLPRLFRTYASALTDYANMLGDDVDAEEIADGLGGLTDTLKSMASATSMVNDEVDKLVNFNDPLKDIAEVLKDINDTMKDQGEFITDLNSDNLTLLNDYMNGLVELSKANTTSLSKNFDSIIKVDFDSPRVREVLTPATITSSAPRFQPNDTEVERRAREAVAASNGQDKELIEMMMKMMKMMEQTMMSLNGNVGNMSRQMAEMNDRLESGIRTRPIDSIT